MPTSRCSFRKDSKEFPILPKCRYDLKCIDYTSTHRNSQYHTVFGFNHEDRLNFLLDSASYNYKQCVNGSYLWEQFTCDLEETELSRNFLMYVYLYVMNNQKNITNDQLFILYQAFITLEEMSITGIHYLNKAFMLWVFNKRDLRYLSLTLKDFIDKGIIGTYYDIDFHKLFNMIKHSKDLNRHYLEYKINSVEELKSLYSTFMFDRVKIEKDLLRNIIGLKKDEFEIIKFQKYMRSKESNIDILSFSNTGLTQIIDIILESRGVRIEQRIVQHYNLSL